MLITLFVHAVDTSIHTSVPPGWRWAVHVGDNPAVGCANAGWCPTDSEAGMEGEMVAVTVVKVLRMAGSSVDYRLVRLDVDPIAAGHDELGA